MSELHISQAIREHQGRQIPTLYEPVANFCWKLIFHVFSMELLHAATEGQGAKKEVCFAHRILVFHFFSLFFLLVVLHDVTFNVTATI
jgi:hypothetical protein